VSVRALATFVLTQCSCMCHTLNLAVDDVIGSASARKGDDAVVVGDDDAAVATTASHVHQPSLTLIKRANRIVVAINRRTRARSMLEALQIADGVSVDRVKQLQMANDTRWGSEMTTLESVLQLRPYLLRMQGVWCRG
jgi:hypothetical protein